MDLKHFSHEHPLGLVNVQEWSRSSDRQKDEEDKFRCFVCGERVKGPSYCCNGCKFYLPFHPPRPLILLPRSPHSGHYSCKFCHRLSRGLVYRCSSCHFDLDMDCALLQLSIAGNFDKLEHFSHKHPLIFNEKYNKRVDGYCQACRKKLSGSTPIYRCLDCNFDLHKECTELPLEINHPLHPRHPLILQTKLPSLSMLICYSCGSICSGFVYFCDSCNFKMDVDCALHQLSIAASFPKLKHFAQVHPLIFMEKHIKTILGDCLGCMKKLSGPIYKCYDCNYFHLHKECAELPLEIDYPYDRKHPLTLLRNPPTDDHPERCSCNLCEIEWKGFVYYCLVCKFGLTLEEVSSSRIIADESHEHPFTLLSRPISFTCDFCGTAGDRTPYLCTTCDLIVHKKCISLPRTIRIMRHYHPISHVYSLRENQSEEWECRICHREVDIGFGSYYCSDSSCNYIAHVNCATHENIWDGSTMVEEDEESKGESMKLITDVFRTTCLGENATAIEIKHAYHNHNLVLNYGGDAKDDSNCDGCMRPISAPYYGCKQFCGFLLHKSCAELPRNKRHPSHKHLLTLADKNFVYYACYCDACHRKHHGFSYNCYKGACYQFKIDIQCSLLADTDTLRHPSHEHPLFLDHNYEGNCNGCSKKIEAYSWKPSLPFRCMRGCEFILDFSCLTLPQMASYKYDKHPLTLTYRDDSDPNQVYCDICEEERDPKHWFYHCAYCDNSVHSECVLKKY